MRLITRLDTPVEITNQLETYGQVLIFLKYHQDITI